MKIKLNFLFSLHITHGSKYMNDTEYHPETKELLSKDKYICALSLHCSTRTSLGLRVTDVEKKII